MKKILCFIDELGSGGAERQLTSLAVLLRKNNYDVDVYCYHQNYFYAIKRLRYHYVTFRTSL